jgi:hypothetical protein
VSAAAAANAGEWANAGNFTFTDSRTDDPPSPAPGYPDGLYRFGLMMDGFWGGTGSAGNSGYLCRFTTGSAGELTLDSQLIGDDNGQIVMMSATDSWNVE